tara:strand:+ start:61 stop:501 length:441 start_codon:yes stop_codon:yes gene_type:complete
MVQKSFDFIDTNIRVCTKCNVQKTTKDFYDNGSNSNGVRKRGNCIDCYQKSNNMRARLEAGFSALKTDYCECCGNSDCKIQMDHDHDIDTFRGFVCASCNTVMGKHSKYYGTMENILATRPESIGSTFIAYYKTATRRAGLTWKRN